VLRLIVELPLLSVNIRRRPLAAAVIGHSASYSPGPTHYEFQ
jgi:hypothetical protein